MTLLPSPPSVPPLVVSGWVGVGETERAVAVVEVDIIVYVLVERRAQIVEPLPVRKKKKNYLKARLLILVIVIT